MSAPSTPTSVLTRNVGNGSVEVQWDSGIEAAFGGLNPLAFTFSSSSYQKIGTTLSPDVLANPVYGDVDADLISRNSGTGVSGRYLRKSINGFTVSSTYTMSIYAKNNGQRYLGLSRFLTDYAIFDLQSGTVANTAGANYVSSSIVSVGSGWYRCSVTFTAVATSNFIYVSLATSSNIVPTEPTSSAGFYIWGLQIVAGVTAVAGPSAVAAHYDIYMSTELAGTYTKVNPAAVTFRKFKIPNIPFGTTVYVKVIAISADGVSSSFSDAADDADADFATATLLARGPIGDVIPAGTMFSQIVDGELIALEILDSVTITG